jgi:hypothetical protein
VSTALDLYAMTNPALAGAVLWAFLQGAERADRGIELPLLFLPIPILLSSTLRTSFQGTNSSTGFYTWLDRHPELTVGFAERVRRTEPITRHALLFAARTHVVTADAEGRFHPTGALSAGKLRRAGEAVRPLFPLAKRFGGWVGEAGATRDVFYAFGLTL